MARDVSCPVCDADLMFSGDETRGDTVVCVYCSAPFTVTRPPSKDDDVEIEEDF